MSDLLDLLRQSLGSNELSAISKKIGADENATKKAISAALPAMIGGLGRQAASPEGASVLSEMLEQDQQGGGFLDNLLGKLSGHNPQEELSENILEKALSGRRDRVEQSVSKTSGLDMETVKKLIAVLGPVLMGVVHNKKKKQNFDDQQLAGYLSLEKDEIEKSSGGLVGQLLDQDSDGDVDMEDFAKLAMGKLF